MSTPIVPPAPEVNPRHAGTACRRVLRRLRQPRLPALPACSRPARSILAAARAPTCLQRELRQLRKPAFSLKATCAWVSRIEPPPHLIHTPRFGTCLEEVLQEAEQGQVKDQSSKEKSAQPMTLPPAPQSLSPLHREHRLEKRHPVPPFPRQIGQMSARQASLYHLPPLLNPGRASLDLLARVAGGYSALASLPGRPQRAVRLPGVFLNSTALHPASRSASPTRLSPGWLEYRKARFSQAPIWDMPSETVSGSTQAWLTRAALLAVAGPAAPLTLLSRLAGLAPSQPGLQGGSTSSVPGNPPGGPSLLQSQAERTPSGFPAWETPFTTAPRGAAPSPGSQAPTGAQQGFYPQDGSLPLPAAGQPHYRPPLAPPLASEHLPTLLTPQAVFDAPTPYAAAAARQEAKEDEVRLVEEDLDVLADKIKRILDDEARRNGIQV